MTIQKKDSIIIKGVKYHLFTTPLDSYWTKRRPKPITRVPSSNCWRGYVATWEIFENDLYLIDIKFYAPDGDLGYKCMFHINPEGLKASWFTGELRIPLGNILYSEVCMDYVYDFDLVIRIKKGSLLGQRYKAYYWWLNISCN